MAIAKQIWIDLILEDFIPDTSFLSRSVDLSPLVEYNKINLAEAGVNPDVLIDNDSFPITATSRTDKGIEVPLHTFDTKNTVVRNIEQKESSYDKMESVVRGHRAALLKKTSAFAAHAWSPTRNTDDTPVVATSGDVNKAKLKALTFEDLLAIEARFRNMDVDPDSLVLVLTAQHRTDLMAQDLKLYKSVLESGKLFSFSVFDFSQLPYFNATTGEKVAFGTKPNATDTQASLIYSDKEVVRAMGDTEVFARYKDPDHRGDIVGFQQRFTAMPLRSKCTASIYSAKTI